MAERKSLSDAMTMDPEKLAFIKQGAPSNPPLQNPSPPATQQKTIELQAPKADDASVQQPKHKPTRPQSRARAPRDAQPDASEILDQVLVPVTIRLQHRTSQALRRAYLEQRLRHAKPDTQQEIVETAVVEWLSAHGFFEIPKGE